LIKICGLKSIKMTDEEKEIEKIKKRRLLVTQEIITTERTYVNQVYAFFQFILCVLKMC
jgi:hypothetical protein